jgi:hypothetical protein
VAVTHERLVESEDYERGLARGQSLMREVNEQIHQLRSRFTYLDDVDEVNVRTIFCECCSDDCMEPIEITLNQYQVARRFPTRFLLVPGHEELVTERVVEQQSNYVIVEKTGVGGEVAIRLDPRRRIKP